MNLLNFTSLQKYVKILYLNFVYFLCVHFKLLVMTKVITKYDRCFTINKNTCTKSYKNLKVDCLIKLLFLVIHRSYLVITLVITRSLNVHKIKKV